MNSIAIIGAGSQGFAMAAHLLSAGVSVNIWGHPDHDPFAPVRLAGGISVTGMVEGLFRPRLMSSDMAEVIEGVGLIMVVVPAHCHESVMTTMAPHLRDGQTVVLNPGRTCGALCCSRLLGRLGCTERVIIAETQTIAYACRISSPTSVSILALKDEVPLAALPNECGAGVIAQLPDCLARHFAPAGNVLETSLGNVGMILHCAPMLLNAGMIESPRATFKFYRDGITPAVAKLLEALDAERLTVARQLNTWTPGVVEWMNKMYTLDGKDLHGCIQANQVYAVIDAPRSLHHRYLLEDVPTGLVPLEAIGRALGGEMKLTSVIIDLAQTVLGVDFRATGRNAVQLGLPQRGTPAEIGRILSGGAAD